MIKKQMTIREYIYTLTYFVSLVPLKVYDIIHGTEFSGLQKKGEKKGYYEYFPSSVFSFFFIKKFVMNNMQGGKGHRVLDIGCGKGLMLYFFSTMDFDGVAGIEYDKSLFELARNNLKVTHEEVEVYHMDALDFAFYKDFDTFYLYNPFNEITLEKCLDKILLSMEDKKRELTLFYCNPRYEDCLIKRGFVKIGSFYYKTVIYRLTGVNDA